MTTNPSELHLDQSSQIIKALKTKIMSPSEFQRVQMNLKHSIILDNAIVGCQFDEVLVEVLRELRMGIIIDRNTSKSRTSWLAGTINNEHVLMVLDSVIRNGITRASIDIWSENEVLPVAILEIIRNTSLGNVSDTYQAIDVSWYLTKQENTTQLIIELLSKDNEGKTLDEDILFFVDYQGIMTERLSAGFPVGQERVSVAVDVTEIHASYSGTLTDPYLTLYISDAEWKSLDKYKCISFSWNDALIHQINQHLSNGTRLTSFEELAQILNIRDKDALMITRNLLLDFCKALRVAGCKSQRVFDHCSRAIILTSLVICFNPPRGLSGYLEMVFGDEEFSLKTDLGSERTWREHMSGIVNLAQDFKPTPVKLIGSKKSRRPGRPPTQLVPKTPPADLFMRFVHEPESIVCRLCRFSNSLA